MRHHPTADPRVFGSGSRERAGYELLQTIASIASVLGFLISLATLPPLLGASRPSGSNVLHALNDSSKAAVLLISFPIFEILNVFLVISIARIAVSVLRRCGVELDTDLGAWCLLLLVLLPVVLGTNLLFMIVLFGDPFTPLPLVCIAGSVLMTMYFAFRWLQKALY
ncbi:MAG TPA: hypothetical protein VF173_08780 [Thermoanaerobaculia bacterium]|nr:hypothetical protein [Thermoanaerobaculia bacterium]